VPIAGFETVGGRELRCYTAGTLLKGANKYPPTTTIRSLLDCSIGVARYTFQFVPYTQSQCQRRVSHQLRLVFDVVLPPNFDPVFPRFPMLVNTHTLCSQPRQSKLLLSPPNICGSPLTSALCLGAFLSSGVTPDRWRDRGFQCCAGPPTTWSSIC